MKVVIFGATGMVGKGVLLECLEDARVEHVLLVSRHATDVSNPKIREIVHADFTEFKSLQRTFAALEGKTENALLGLPFKAAFMFRPSYIQPLRGIRSK